MEEGREELYIFSDVKVLGLKGAGLLVEKTFCAHHPGFKTEKR